MTPEFRTLEEGKKVLASEAGKPISGYPLEFAAPVMFGPPPQRGDSLVVNSASASLLQLDGRMLVVTCHHVLQEYRKRLTELGDCSFQVGNCRLEPLAQLVAEDATLDIAVIAVTDAQVRELREYRVENFGRNFVVPPAWPPGGVAEGDFVAFGGFPGSLRRVMSWRELSFGSYSSGAAGVTVVGKDYLVCQFDRTNWVKCGYEPEPSTIRGLSGGPAFAVRRAGADILWYEFIGIVYEFSEQYELLYVRLARIFGSDGIILG